MRPAILHGFRTSAKKRVPGRLTELAHYGWMPLAAALFGTMKWQPQWLHHNFLPVIGLRVHAKVPPSPLTDRQLVAFLGLWERKAHRGLQCRAFYRQYSSTLVSRPHSQQWAHGRRKSRATPLILSTVPNRCIQARHPAIRKRCLIALASGHNGFFHWRNFGKTTPHARPTADVTLQRTWWRAPQSWPWLRPLLSKSCSNKVYGPSLAMIDDWEQRVTQLGLTKTTHEYAVYQLLATAIGWCVWRKILPAKFADQSFCSLGRCASWQRLQSVLRMHDRHIQRGQQQSAKSFGVITPKARSFCWEPVSPPGAVAGTGGE